MSPQEEKTRKINALFEKHGIEKRKYASTMATILGIHYNSARSKLDNKRGIRNEELQALYSYFNEPYIVCSDNKNFNCVYITNTTHQRCRIKIQETPANEIELANFYAAKRDDGYYVINVPPSTDSKQPLFKVTTLEFLPAPRVAILDNDPHILSLTKKTLKRYGIESDCYQTEKELNEALNQTTYDAFIVDWLLDYGETTDKVIRNVSNKLTPPPIILLTGQLDQYENKISNILLEYKNVQLIEKPSRPIVIVSPLISNLFFN
ncbi:response regulator [Salmonella enterica subsp. enterica serovar Shubra]|nr:response regulator [Salmonella enterica subsp. enterica serovar Shubra]